MCKDRNMFALILGIMFVVLFITVDVFADVEYADLPDKAGLGKYDGTGITLFGDFKDCGTDAFFYLLPVNESNEDITVVLPTRVFVEGRWFKVDRSSYTYKNLGENWVPDSFADAKTGEPLDAEIDYTVTIPAHSGYSIMGRIKDIPRDFFSRTHTSDDDVFYAKARITVNNAPMIAEGYLADEGSACNSVLEVPIAGENYIYGFYRVAENSTDVCSMAFYFLVENLDDRYSTTVELPRWVEINGDRWTIGCDPIANDCLVSGFRHYAYTEMNEDGTFKDSEFTFCDQDYALGDNCYQENGLWWLEVPAGKSIVIRSMVNDFCSPQNDLTNPLMNSYINMAVQLGDSGTNLRMIGGDVIGTAVSGLGSAKVITFLGDDPDSMISSEANADPVRVAEPVAEDEFTADVAKSVDLPDANTADPDPIQFFVLK